MLRIDDTPTDLSDGYEAITAERVLVPVGCVRGGEWVAADVAVPA